MHNGHRFIKIPACVFGYTLNGGVYGTNGSTNFNGSTVSDNRPTQGGFVVLDKTMTPLMRGAGQFVTTSSVLHTLTSTQSYIKIEATGIPGVAAEYIPKHHVVYVNAQGEVGLVENGYNLDDLVWGILDNDANMGDVVRVHMSGFFDDTIDRWESGAKKLYVGDNGVLTTTPILGSIRAGFTTSKRSFVITTLGSSSPLIEGTGGEKGDRGSTGPQGIQGEKGDAGSQGIQGEKGETGSQGVQGEKGDAGSQGIQGEKGETGSQGIQGEKGETGSQGIQGEKGEKGDAGSQGIQGIQGIQGEKGDAGSQGIQGEKGEKGDTGSQGIQGEKGGQDFTIVDVSASITVSGLDSGKWLLCNSSSDITITVGQSLDINNDPLVGINIVISQTGTGKVYIAGDTGVTVLTPAGNGTRTTNSTVVITSTSGSTWLLGGDVSMI